jgi:hypothetical protein
MTNTPSNEEESHQPKEEPEKSKRKQATSCRESTFVVWVLVSFLPFVAEERDSFSLITA